MAASRSRNGGLSTAQRLAHEIRGAIYAGEISPGERLVEEDLAGRFGVSRGPVREAIRILAAERSAVLRPNRGAVVIEPTASDVLEVYAVRKALGLLALTQAARPGAVAPGVWQTLDDQLEGLNAFEVRGHQLTMVATDLEFQTSLVAASGLSRVAQTFHSTAQDIQLFVRAFRIPYAPSNHTSIVENHRTLLDAVRDHDEELTRSLWLAHIRRNVVEFTSYLPDSADDMMRNPLTSDLLDEG